VDALDQPEREREQPDDAHAQLPGTLPEVGAGYRVDEP
jgi:hypothetical protein